MRTSLAQFWGGNGMGFRRTALIGTVIASLVFIALALTTETVHPSNPGLVLLLMTLLVSATFGFRAGMLTALVSNALLAFFFLQPLYEFWAEDPQELASLAFFTLASAVGSSLLQTYRNLADRAQYGRAQAEALLNLNRAVLAHPDAQDALHEVVMTLVSTFAVKDAAVITPSTNGWRVVTASGQEDADRLPFETEGWWAQQAMDRGVIQRPNAELVLVPLANAGRVLGVMRVTGPFGETPFRESPDQTMLAFAGEAVLALDRVDLARAAREAEALKDSDATKTVILNSISHDLKTPLATIKAATSSLLGLDSQWTQGDLNAFLHSIESEADRLDRTISELLDLNRIQAGAVVPLIHPEWLPEIAESAVELTAGAVGSRKLVISVPEITVCTDALLLRQALANLLENAAVHSRAEGVIRLDARCIDEVVRISVTDEGPSPSAADMPYIFDPFYRSSQSGLRHTGTGLGLAIVKGFVSVCGGTVSASGSPAGSTFTICLPRESSAEGSVR